MQVTSGRRGPTPLNVGTVVWLSSELMFFAALRGSYLSLRASSGGPWPPRGAEADVLLGLVLTVVLLTSSWTVHQAVVAIEHGDVDRFRRWVVATVALGVLFLGGQAYEWAGLDFSVSSHPFGSSFFTITGFHGAHLLAGLLALVVLLGRSAWGGFHADRAPAARAVSAYWHFVDAVWVGVFVLLYVVT